MNYSGKSIIGMTLRIAATLLAGLLCFLIGKLVFLAVNHLEYAGIGLTGIFSVISHGFAMDLSMAAYATFLPSLLFLISLFIRNEKVIYKILSVYFILISVILSAVVLLDSVLYGYWHFKLDATPLFYFFSSPKSALASASIGEIIFAAVGWIILSSLFFVIYKLPLLKRIPTLHPFENFSKRRDKSAKTTDTSDNIRSEKSQTIIRPGLSGSENGSGVNIRRIVASAAVFILIGGLLFIAARGGVTVSTMNLSRAYFSKDNRLNHAAVNPAFSLMYSLSHQDNFSGQYRFFDEQEAARQFSLLREQPCVDSLSLLEEGSRPDIYLIILESFSSHLFPSLGGEQVATKLDSIANDGLLYTNFYANSFRTDRGLVSVLGGYPGQPSTSIMKYVSKTENLPAWPRSLKEKAGYETQYYYGGDANFTNMKAYLVNAGFDYLVSDVDFPVGQRLSKWGAHDDVLFSRVLEELTPYDSKHPRLRVVQTSSSHEPFEVPYDDKGRFTDQRARAFAYADSCAASFIDKLRSLPQWDKSLVVLVPDHYGAYPVIEEALSRHQIPLIMTGGALIRKGRDETFGSQIDIAATMLSAMGVDHDEFIFSRSLLNPCTDHFAFFADSSVIGMVSEKDSTVYNLDADMQLENYSNRSIGAAKAFLQTLYDDLSKR